MNGLMSGPGAIQGVDHLVFAMRALDVAARRFRNLGFQLTPKGGHPALGSANHTFLFPSGCYGELLSVERPGPFTSYYQDFAQAGEGLAGLAFRISDPEAARAALIAAGFKPEEPMDFSRPVDLDGESREARFTIIQLPLESLPGGRIFFCRHHTPELVWRSDMMDHMNGAVTLDSVVLAHSEPERAAQLYAPLGVDRMDVRLEIMSPQDFTEAFREEPVAERFAAVRFRVDDLQKTAATLTVNAIRFVEMDGAVQVPAADGLGTRLIFKS